MEGDQRNILSIIGREERTGTQLGRGVLKDFGNEVPPGQRYSTELPVHISKDINPTETTTHELGAYLAVPVQEYRDDLEEETVVHYVQITAWYRNKH